MTEITPNNRAETLAYCRAQRDHTSPPPPYGPDWHNDCQAFAHVAHGVMVGGFGSAYAQWLGMDAEDRHPTSDLSHAPVSSLLFSKGTNPAGHVWVAAWPFRSGVSGSFSTDIVRYGCVDKVSRTAPRDAWGHTLLGWGTSVNGYAIDLTGNKPARPKENQHYLLIARAITNLEGALETAKRQHDKADIALLVREIQHQKRLYSRLRHA